MALFKTYLLELEMQLEDALVEETPEASFSLRAVIPLTVDDLECNVFVGCTCNEPDDACPADRGRER
jgi:hypothetical protein